MTMYLNDLKYITIQLTLLYRSQYGIVTFEVGRESINAAKEFVEGKEYFINVTTCQSVFYSEHQIIASLIFK